MKPLLKWTGGKAREWPFIRERLPALGENGRYIEPFIGGGAVFWAMPPGPALLNDRSRDLIDFYRAVKQQDADLFACLDQLAHVWKALDGASDDAIAYKEVLMGLGEAPLGLDAEAIHAELDRRLEDKAKRLAKMQNLPEDLSDNRRAAAKSVIYYRMRHLFNQGEVGTARHLAAYVTLKELAYAAMWRTSRLGFNVPFGGMSYAKRDLHKKWQGFSQPKVIEKLSQASFYNDDFHTFLEAIEPTSDDVMFLDPPYDSTFTDYDDASWTAEDQQRLADVLRDCPARWLLVIARTPLIEKLYPKRTYRITRTDKTYGVEYMGRNKAQRRVEHLLISPKS